MKLLAIRDLNSQDPLPGLGPKHQPASAPVPTPAAREVRPGIIEGPDGKLSTNITHAPPQPPTPPAALEAMERVGEVQDHQPDAARNLANGRPQARARASTVDVSWEVFGSCASRLSGAQVDVQNLPRNTASPQAPKFDVGAIVRFKKDRPLASVFQPLVDKKLVVRSRTEHGAYVSLWELRTDPFDPRLCADIDYLEPWAAPSHKYKIGDALCTLEGYRVVVIRTDVPHYLCQQYLEHTNSERLLWVHEDHLLPIEHADRRKDMFARLTVGCTYMWDGAYWRLNKKREDGMCVIQRSNIVREVAFEELS